MGKFIIHDGPIHMAVLAWIKVNNIDLNLVRDYKVERNAQGAMWINLTMWCNDKAEEQEAV